MNLKRILSRFAEGILSVDENTNIVNQNRRTKEQYLPGVKSLTEPQFVSELILWWKQAYPNDFIDGSQIRNEIKVSKNSDMSIDIGISSPDTEFNPAEWLIEVKNLTLVGNNGKNNDFGVAKMLSPYLKDRSLIHDLMKLKKLGKARNKAVIVYSFYYDLETCTQAELLHPAHKTYIDNIRKVCLMDDKGKYDPRNIISWVNQILSNEGLVKQCKSIDFNGAWRHPCGGNGFVFGWLIN